MTLDHQYWMRPEDMGTMERPAFYVDPSMPGTDVVAAASAALAAASMAFSPQNREYAGALLKESQALYTFAAGYLGSYSKWVPTEGAYYSESYYDDLAWAAAWIYKASGSGQYLKEAENWCAALPAHFGPAALAAPGGCGRSSRARPPRAGGQPLARPCLTPAPAPLRPRRRYQMYFKTEAPPAGNMIFDFGHIVSGVELLLAQATNKVMYVERVEKFLNNWMTGKGVVYTDKGLAMMPPNGTLQYTANTAMLAVLYGKSKGGSALEYNCWTRKQIAYMLGDSGQSFVVGFGALSPKKVPHRGASCPDPGDGICNWQTGYLTAENNPHILYGALVGGPDKEDKFYDDRCAACRRCLAAPEGSSRWCLCLHLHWWERRRRCCTVPGPAFQRAHSLDCRRLVRRAWNSTMNRVSLLNNAGFTAAIAGLKSQGVSEAKCQQGTGLIQEAVKKSQGVRY